MNSSSFSGAGNNEVVSAEGDIKLTSPADSCNSQSDMKRVAAKEKIERYYYQLTDGCGDPLCDNELCASSGAFLYFGINRNEAAGKAVELFKNRSRLCDVSSRKISKVSDNEESLNTKEESPNMQSNSCSSTSALDYDALSKKNETDILSEEILISTIDEAEKTGEWTQFSILMFSSFSNPQVLKESFIVKPIVKEVMSNKNNDRLVEATKVPCNTKSRIKDSNQKITCNIDGCNADEDNRMGEGSAVDGPAYLDEDIGELEGVMVNDNIDEAASEHRNSLRMKFFGNFEDSILNLTSEYEVTVNVNVEALSRCYERLSLISDSNVYCDPIKAALIHLSRRIESSLHSGNDKDSLYFDPKLPNIYAIILEMPLLDSLELLELAVPNFYRTVRLLPIKCQVALVRHWAKRYGESPNGAAIMKRVVCAIQQMITVRVVIRPWAMLDQTVNDDDAICGAVILLKLFYYASMLGGRMDEKWLERKKKESSSSDNAAWRQNSRGSSKYLSSFSTSEDEESENESGPKVFLESHFENSKDRLGSMSLYLDLLGESLGLRAMDCREPLLSPKEFVNETLSDAIEMDKDYAYYRVRPEWRFSFMANPFVLTTAAKQMGLYFDNRIRMFDERRATLFQNVLYAGSSTASMTAPYLKLNVRRDHIVGDALVNLETITMNSPQDLKKQLFVEFEGEQGVDEGGVSKEFFQLIVEELFNPDFGMFRLDAETQTFWFNELSFENDAEFTLIGILIGLAIYNNVILDIRFPMVLYRKLLSRRGNFNDLLLARPTLGRSLLSLLNYEGDVEELLLNFCISTTDVFGNIHTHKLKPGGAEISVTNENRKEFVELYADFLLNKSVEKQFKAFRRGFRLVSDESPLAQLFNAEELELLICGSDENSDFHALEQSAEYDGGYKKDTPVIRYFWETVHEMSEEQKKKLLQFTTGSDRVPIGGLAKLRLIIARNGQDTDRLPTSHTCFNVLLLPEYSSKEKLKERLLKAITYSKGFGML